MNCHAVREYLLWVAHVLELPATNTKPLQRFLSTPNYEDHAYKQEGKGAHDAGEWKNTFLKNG